MMRTSAAVRIAAVAVVGLAGFAPPASAATGSQIVGTAWRYLGRPYWYHVPYNLTPRWFDCSAFTKYVYARNGIYLPRSSREQATRGWWVSGWNLHVGDLCFFSLYPGGPISHVAINMGGSRLIHTYGAGGVRISDWNRYWSARFKMARRFVRW